VLLVLATPAYAIEADVPNVFTPRTVTRSADVNENFESLEDSINREERFYVVEYAAANPSSATGGIREALTACGAAGGGVVVLPVGLITINATGLTSPIIPLPTVDSGAHPIAVCELVGYGDANNVFNPDELTAASVVRVTNSSSMTATSSLKVGIHMAGLSAKIRTFSFMMDDTDTATRGVLIASAPYGSEALGEHGINGWVIDDVTIKGDGMGGPGIGVQLMASLKGNLRGGEIGRWDTALFVGAPTVGVITSNGNHIQGASLRDSDIGLELDGAFSCTDIAISGSTIENNTIGMRINSGSNCKVRDMGSHWEALGPGVQADRRQIQIDATNASYIGFGPRFSSALDAGNDIVRSAAQGTEANQSDVIYGGYIRHGANYSAGNLRIVDARIAGTATFTGNVTMQNDDCLIMRDSDGAGATACETLNGAWDCEVTTNLVCGDGS